MNMSLESLLVSRDGRIQFPLCPVSPHSPRHLQACITGRNGAELSDEQLGRVVVTCDAGTLSLAICAAVSCSKSVLRMENVWARR